MSAKSKRDRLHLEQDGKCFWCGRKTIIYCPANGRLPPNAATYDHLSPNGQRMKGMATIGVLACYECNHKRGSQPFHESSALVQSRKRSAT